jgi:hypothetical protein
VHGRLIERTEQLEGPRPIGSRHGTTASASISICASASISRATSTIVVAGRMSLKT